MNDNNTNSGTLVQSSVEGFFETDGLVSEQTIISLATKLVQRKLRSGVRLSTSDESRKYLQLKLCSIGEPVFFAAYLDGNNTLIACETITGGDFEEGHAAFARKALKSVSLYDSVAVFLAVSVPEGSDSKFAEEICSRVSSALAIVDVKTIGAYQLIAGQVTWSTDRAWL